MLRLLYITASIRTLPTTFEFTKTDITSGAELTGATLTVLDKDGNVVDTWTSDAKEAHVIKRLVVERLTLFVRNLLLTDTSRQLISSLQ